MKCDLLVSIRVVSRPCILPVWRAATTQWFCSSRWARTRQPRRMCSSDRPFSLFSVLPSIKSNLTMHFVVLFPFEGRPNSRGSGHWEWSCDNCQIFSRFVSSCLRRDCDHFVNYFLFLLGLEFADLRRLDPCALGSQPLCLRFLSEAILSIRSVFLFVFQFGRENRVREGPVSCCSTSIDSRAAESPGESAFFATLKKHSSSCLFLGHQRSF